MTFLTRFLVVFVVLFGSSFAQSSPIGNERDQILRTNEHIHGSRSARSERSAIQSRKLNARVRKDLFDHDVGLILNRTTMPSVKFFGACPDFTCDEQRAFQRLADSAAGELSSASLGQLLERSSGDIVNIHWRYKPASERQMPTAFEFMVIANDRFRIYEIVPTIQGRQSSRNRGVNSRQGPHSRKQPDPLPGVDLRSPIVNEIAFSTKLPIPSDSKVQVFLRPIGDAGTAQSTRSSEDRRNDVLPLQIDSVPTFQRNAVNSGVKESLNVLDIKFKDRNLARCVSFAVGWDITFPVSALSSLNCSGWQINSLIGLESLSVLRVLDLSDNNISNINALASLTGLFSVNLADNAISSIVPLNGLAALEYLHIERNQVSDLSPITGASSLDTLLASGNLIDFVPDASLTSLRVVDLAGNPVTDIAGLSSTLTLESVDLSAAAMGDMAPLLANASQNDSSLIEVDLTLNPTIDCAQLQTLTSQLGSGISVTPGSCIGLQAPVNLTTTANPAVLSNFSLNWQFQDQVPSGGLFELRRRLANSLARLNPWSYSTSNTSVNLNQFASPEPGLYIFDVRLCLSSNECSAWSQGIEQIITADSTVPFQVALATVQDANLRHCILDAQSSSANGIFHTAGELTRLHCNHANVSSLSGLSQFPALSELSLAGNQIRHLSELQALQSLQMLDLSDNLVESDELAALSQARSRFAYLDLGGNSINDITALGHLDIISELRLSETEVSDLSLLSDTYIEVLRASNTTIQAIPTLNGTYVLELENNSISDIGALASVASTLQQLNLSNNPLAAPSATLSQLVSLRELHLESTGITSLSFTSGMNNLEVLRLSGNVFDSLSPVGQLNSLEALYLNDSNVGTLSFMSNLNQLQILEVDGSNLSSIIQLQNHPNLRRLLLGNGNLAVSNRLDPLASLMSLQELVLAETGVTNISPALSLAASTSASLVLVDATLEQNIPCAQLSTLSQSGLLAPSPGNPARCVATQPQLEKIRLNDDLETYWVHWTQPGLPPGHVATGEYHIEYRSGSASIQELVSVDAVSTGVESTLPTPSEPSFYTFRVRLCASPGDCTPGTSWQYADYPLLRPLTPQSVPGASTFQLSWGYPARPPADQSVTYFRVAPLFPMAAPVYVHQQSSEGWGTSINEPGNYPGLAAKISACRSEDSVEVCGSSSHVSFINSVPDIVLDPPASPVLTVSNADDGLFNLSWQPSVDAPNGQYFKVEELEQSSAGFSPTGHVYTTDKSSVPVQRYIARNGSNLAFQVSSCVEGESEESCSTPSVTNSLPVQTDIDLGWATGVCWEQHGGFGGIRLKWSYHEGWPSFGIYKDSPVQFSGKVIAGNIPVTSSEFSVAYSNMRYNQISSIWYWESEPFQYNAANQVQLWPEAGPVNGSAVTLTPRNHLGQWDYSTWCGNSQLFQDPPGPNGRGVTTEGPSNLSPGHWTTYATEINGEAVPALGHRTGWQFYWSNDMSPGRANRGHGSSDLVAIWYTYQKYTPDDGSVYVDQEWTPVWFYSAMKITDCDTGSDDGSVQQCASGPLLMPDKDHLEGDIEIGTLEVLFDQPESLGAGGSNNNSPNHAWVRIQPLHGSGLMIQQPVVFPIRDFLLDSQNFDPEWFSLNQNDHFRGIWYHGASDTGLFDVDKNLNADFLLSEWIHGQMHSWGVLGFDEGELIAGVRQNRRPIWNISFKCAGNPDHPDYSSDCVDSDPPGSGGFQYQQLDEFHFVYPGVSPFAPDMGNFSNNTVPAQSGTGVSRAYAGTDELNAPDDHRSGRACIDLTGVVGDRFYSFKTGTLACGVPSQFDIELKKVANDHHIAYQIEGIAGQDCDLDDRSCHLLLEWFTDDDFSSTLGPDVLPMISAPGFEYPQPLENFCGFTPPKSFSEESFFCDITEPGEYKFRLVSRPASNFGFDSVKSSILATSEILTVNGTGIEPAPDPEPAPVGDNRPPASDPYFPQGDVEPALLLKSSKIGATRGEFSVSESGAAEYAIPIMTVPGSGGVVPEVSIRYNSQAGESYLGRGWTITGMSTLTRCGQTLIHDGKTTGVSIATIIPVDDEPDLIIQEDRFCLDGQRLVLVDGDFYGENLSRYRLEIDDQTVVTAHAANSEIIGPTHFTVQRRDGSIATYGVNPANIEPEDSDGVRALTFNAMFVWPISRFEDSSNNYIKFEYKQPGRNEPAPWIEWLPSKIEYTGNVNANQEAFASIEFMTEVREHGLDRQPHYVAGNRLMRSTRISQINSKIGEDLVRRYKLKFDDEPRLLQEDMLAEIAECWGWLDHECFAATKFNWNTGFVQQASMHLPGRIDNFRGAQAADLSGNGRQEIIYVRKDSDDRAKFGVLRNIATDQVDVWIDAEYPDDDDIDEPITPPEFSAECEVKVGDLGGWTAIDVYGIGEMGVAYSLKKCNDPEKNGIYFHPWNSTTNRLRGVDPIRLASLPSILNNTGLDLRLAPIDANGDGRIDLVLTFANEDGTAASFGATSGYLFLNQSSTNQSGTIQAQFDAGLSISGARTNADWPNGEFGPCKIDGNIAMPIGSSGNCRLEYFFQPFNAPVTNSDHGANASLVGRATRRLTYEQIIDERGTSEAPTSDLNDLYTGTLPNGGELLETWTITAAWDFSTGPDLINAVATPRVIFPPEGVNDLTAFQPTSLIRPVDWNTDGLMDYVVFHKNGNSENPATIDLLVSDGNGGISLEESQKLGTTIDYDFVNSILLQDATGNGKIDLLIPHAISDSDGYGQYWIRQWPWIQYEDFRQLDGRSAVFANYVNGEKLDCEIPGSRCRYDHYLKQNEGDQTIFADINGDGKPDYIGFGGKPFIESGDSRYYIHIVNGYRQDSENSLEENIEVDLHKVYKITDGFGYETEIDYASLAESSVYERGDFELAQISNPEFPAYNMSAPISVVASVQSDSPGGYLESQNTKAMWDQNARAGIRYHYSGARLQGGGRGFLGFRELHTYDLQSGVLTSTRFRQDFPYIGRPEATRQWLVSTDPWGGMDSIDTPSFPEWNSGECESNTAGAFTLSCSDTVWSSVETLEILPSSDDRPLLEDPGLFEESSLQDHTQPLLKQVYVGLTEEWSFVPTNNGVGNIIGSKQTAYSMTINATPDQYGNTALITESTFIPGQELPARTTITSATYYDDALSLRDYSDRWYLGRLKCSTVSTTRDTSTPSGSINSETVTRRSGFVYHPNTGLLTHEIIEPDASFNCNSKTIDQTIGGAKVTAYGHDNFGNRISTIVSGTELDGVRRSENEYHEGRLVSKARVYVGSSAKQIVENWFDKYGNVIEKRDAQGNIHSAYFDQAGRPFYQYLPDGSWSKVIQLRPEDLDFYLGTPGSCDLEGDPTEEALQSDPLDDPGEVEVNLRQVAFARWTTNSDGSETVSCVDKLGLDYRQLVRSFHGDWIVTDQFHDYAARSIANSVPRFLDESRVWNITVHDVLGRPTLVRQPNGLEQKTFYNGLLVRTEHDSNSTEINTVVEREFNVFGEKVLESRSPNAGESRFGYDALGQLSWVDGPLVPIDDADDDSIVTEEDIIEIFYDSFGNKRAVSDPDKGTWYYRYNVMGELMCQADSRGMGVSNQRDSLGRVTRRDDLSNITLPINLNSSNSLCEIDGVVAGAEVLGFTLTSFGLDQLTDDYGQVLSVHHEETIDENGSRVIVTESYEYDSYAGRNTLKTTTIEEIYCNSLPCQPGLVTTYDEQTTFDSIGRVFQRFDASGDGQGQRLHYNNNGYLEALQESRDGVNGSYYWTVESMDALGNITLGHLGNGMEVHRQNDSATGEIKELFDYHPGRNIFGRYFQYNWDQRGRLSYKQEITQTIMGEEMYSYDGQDRLLSVSRRGPSQPNYEIVQSIQYDSSGAGNITSKSDIGDYEYQHTDNALGGPHAVSSAGDRSFTYDRNGNLIEDQFNGVPDRTLSYSSFDKLRKVDREGVGQTEFAYGPDRKRVVQRKSIDGITIRTHYVGAVEFDYLDDDLMPNEVRRSTAGVALVTTDAFGDRTVRYQHRDHLGSIVMISDEWGEILARMAFDAWGNRRDPYLESDVPTWLQWEFSEPPWIQAAGNLPQYTPRGFTGHEHLDHFGIIHMNGRIYDSALARFMQADSLMEDSVTLNRYTYVHNNPFAYTDPSGHLSFKQFARIAASVAISIYSGGSAAGVSWGLFGGTVSTGTAMTTVAVGGALSSAVASGSWEGAYWGAFSAQLFFGAGQWIGSSDWARGSFAGDLSGAGFAMKTLSHGLIGGTVSHLQGGRFGHGFISSGAGAAVTPYVSNRFNGNRFARGAAIALVGGSASSLTGGKFANGAVTAAMAFSFNECVSGGCVRRDRAHEALTVATEAAFSGDFASGGSRAMFPTKEAAVETWGAMAGALTRPYNSQFRFEIGAAIIPIGDQWTWSSPVIGSRRGSAVDLTSVETIPGAIPIHTHPRATSFSGTHLIVGAGGALIGNGFPDGDLRRAWQNQTDSYVVPSSGPYYHFNYSDALNAGTGARLGDYVSPMNL